MSPTVAADLATEQDPSDGTLSDCSLSEGDTTDYDPFERDPLEVMQILPFCSRSPTSSRADEVEAGGHQQSARPTPQTNMHKAEAGEFQGATPMRQRVKSLEESEYQPRGFQTPELGRRNPMKEWPQRTPDRFEIEGIDGPFALSRF